MSTAHDDLPARVLSGIQPSGRLHLGNYFGAIAQQVALQDEFPNECFYFIADYHALTTLRDAKALRQNVFDAALTYLACGLDPERATLFRQSDVPEVTELTWLLSTVTGLGLLKRGHSYKAKVDAGITPVAGLLYYPVLMAADILIYGSSMVPVGKDQVQHVEMTQDMATYFNQTYCKDQPILRRPEWRLSKTPYVPGLDGRKMSKSYGNTIPLFLAGKKLKKLVGTIKTDSTPLGQPLPLTRTNELGETQKDNVYALLELFCDESELAALRGCYETGTREGEPFGYGHAKAMLKTKIEQYFADMSERREHLLAHPEEVEAVLERGAARARALARETLDACKRSCGLLR